MRITSACSIHGRFQPFHNGHLQYFRWAQAIYENVFVGITQIYGSSEDAFPGAPHRGEANNNPLSYFERAQLIEATLVWEGVDISSFRIIPFPIEDGDRLRFFLPISIPCCTTIHSEWNEHKVRVLRDLGYTVKILSDDESCVPRTSGSQIRDMIKAKDARWRLYVPKGGVNYIETTLMERFLLKDQGI